MPMAVTCRSKITSWSVCVSNCCLLYVWLFGVYDCLSVTLLGWPQQTDMPDNLLTLQLLCQLQHEPLKRLQGPKAFLWNKAAAPQHLETSCAVSPTQKHLLDLEQLVQQCWAAQQHLWEDSQRKTETMHKNQETVLIYFIVKFVHLLYMK